MKTNQSTKKQVVIIGGGYAGTLAALRLAGKTEKQSVQITLVNGADTFVERIRHHQLAANQPPPRRQFTQLLDKTGIRFMQGWVTAVSPQQSTITLQTQTGEQQLAYDNLVYALGSHVDSSLIPGIQEHAFTLGSEQTAQQLQQALPDIARKNGRLLVIGGGLTGIEAATEIAEAYPGLQVTLATRESFGQNLSAKGAAHVRNVFEQLSINLQEKTAVTRIEAHAAHTNSGSTIPFDICLWAGPFTVPTLARESGLPVADNGRLLVNASLQVQNHPNIYAIGDAAQTPLRMACATAMPMGAYAAVHLAARLKGTELPGPFRFAYVLQCISLGRKQALVQFVHADDTPKEKILTGKTAVLVKELICRFTIWGLKLEKRLPGSYPWLQADIMEPQTNKLNVAVSLQK
jgi:NADH dehydrogenase